MILYQFPSSGFNRAIIIETLSMGALGNRVRSCIYHAENFTCNHYDRRILTNWTFLSSLIRFQRSKASSFELIRLVHLPADYQWMSLVNATQSKKKKKKSHNRPLLSLAISSIQLLSGVWHFVTPWTAAGHASLFITNSWNFAQTHVHWVGDAIQLSHPLLSPSLLPSIFLSIRVFSN